MHVMSDHESDIEYGTNNVTLNVLLTICVDDDDWVAVRSMDMVVMIGVCFLFFVTHVQT